MSKPTMPPIRRTDRPASLNTHEGWSSRLKKQAGSHENDFALTRALQWHKQLTDAWDGLESMRQSRDPRDTPAKHLEKIDKALSSLTGTFRRRADDILDSLTSRRSGIIREIHERLGVKNCAELAEARALLRGMSASERGQTLATAIEQKDSVFLSALHLTESPLLMGMSADQVEQYQQRAARRHAPDLLALDDALHRAQGLVLDAMTDSVGLAEQAAGSSDQRAQFEAEAEAADDAALRFQKALGA